MNPDLENSVYNVINDVLRTKHSRLTVSIPASGALSDVEGSIPSPDLLITNPATGKKLALEIKQAASELPLSLYPSLKKMNDAIRASGTDFVVLSATPPSGSFSSNIGKSNIDMVYFDHAEDIADKIEGRLKRLEGEQ